MRGRRTTKKSKNRVLNVNSVSSIPKLEKLLESGTMKFIMVYGEWCGACHKFRRDVWDPMTKTKAIHSRAAVRDDMVGQTSLGDAKFEYLPSIIVVDEKGEMQTFNTPEGKQTNAMPTPKNLDDMKRIVNVPVNVSPVVPVPPVNVSRMPPVNVTRMPPITPLPSMTTARPMTPSEPSVRFNNLATRNTPSPIKRNQTPYYNYTDVIRTRPVSTPDGDSYVPLQGGGSLLSALQDFVSRGGGIKIVRQTRRKSKSPQ